MIKLNKELTGITHTRLKLELLARFLLLLALFKQKGSTLSPIFFLREQLNVGAGAIAEFVRLLKGIPQDQIPPLFQQTKKEIEDSLGDRALFIVVDEAHVAQRILPNNFISPSAIKEKSFLDSKGRIKVIHYRSFLTPLCSYLQKCDLTFVVLGTHLSLIDADQVYYVVGKPSNFVTITNFPLNNLEKIKHNTKRLLNVEDTDFPDDHKLRKLEGRNRFSINIINEIIRQSGDHSYRSKKERLNLATDAAIASCQESLRVEIERILDIDRTGSLTSLLGRMVLAYKLKGGKISFARQKECDFVDKGICHLKPSGDDFSLILFEELVIDVIEEELAESCIDPEFFDHLESLKQQ